MSALLIDQGNTACKIQYRNIMSQFTQSTSLTTSVTSTVIIKNKELLAGENKLSNYLNLLNAPSCTQVILASVAKTEYCQALYQQIESHHWSIKQIYTQPYAFGVTHAYEDCLRHGVDRWLAILAAYNLKKSSVIVVDCGTAITVDAVNTKGQHLGGYIVPGESLMAQALQLNTGAIKLLTERQRSYDYGCSTEENVFNGVGLMAETFLRQLVANAKNMGFIIFVTGGGAIEYSAVWSDSIVNIMPDLVLQGLSLFVDEKCGSF